MIPQSNLSRLANRLARAGGRRIPESVLERDYCLSWFLAGLSQSPLRDRLFFKGGTALKKCYFPDYRFSEDLDFTLAEEVPFETIRNELDAAFEESYRDSGVLLRYARSDRQPHANSHTFYLNYEGPLGGLPSGKEVKTDITIKETVIFPIEERPVLRAYEEYEDIPGNAVVKVYSIPFLAELPRFENSRKTGMTTAESWLAHCQRRLEVCLRGETDDFYLCATLHGTLCPFQEASGNLF